MVLRHPYENLETAGGTEADKVIGEARSEIMTALGHTLSSFVVETAGLTDPEDLGQLEDIVANYLDGESVESFRSGFRNNLLALLAIEEFERINDV